MGFLRRCPKRRGFFRFGICRCALALFHGRTHQIVKQSVVRFFVGFLLFGYRGGSRFFGFGFFNIPFDRNGIDRSQLEAFYNAVDLRSVLGTHHNIHHAVCGFFFAPQSAVNYAVAFRLGSKLFQMFLSDGKNFQFLSTFEHGG